MKAPLRFAFGWVVYFAIFIAIAPAVRSCVLFIEHWPVAGLASLVFSALALVVLIAFVVPRFYRWLDAPRARS